MTASRRTIFLKDFVLPVRMGIHAHERNGPQRVAINVTLELGPGDGPASDRIADVLNYDVVRETILELVADRHINLQETLCHEILERLMADARVKAATVSTMKPDVYPDCGGVGYEVTARR
ncbi:MAG: dihydroneopterin aldolase [Sphingomonadales bacterium]|nr:dihydroneopterin aldolase [Sphingomonadales bacterium]